MSLTFWKLDENDLWLYNDFSLTPSLTFQNQEKTQQRKIQFQRKLITSLVCSYLSFKVVKLIVKHEEDVKHFGRCLPPNHV